MNNNEQPTYEQLTTQLRRQNTLIQALQNEVGALTGEKLAVSIAYQESQKELEKVQADKVAELDAQADEESAK
ncbi:hypothetical protein JOC34_002805 [Virgibacillus halotolerans]|uniref:hypothetical protein n=1 Tax=Virgibacillus halotolerans TaxID=1071053 RepID=UPI001961E1DC|nr:hypothetical protein [Virgibacillus halotolerans]MBM7600414.1 hypothetical protein [Virgibacillus halotolerans]